LCHPLPLSAVHLDIDPVADGLKVTASARTNGQTGVEMEALTAVSLALLTIYDMAKSIDKGMIIKDIRLLSKSGGRSGLWQADA
jgi:cyclic pyranopterin phosphate synthase